MRGSAANMNCAALQPLVFNVCFKSLYYMLIILEVLMKTYYSCPYAFSYLFLAQLRWVFRRQQDCWNNFFDSRIKPIMQENLIRNIHRCYTIIIVGRYYIDSRLHIHIFDTYDWCVNLERHAIPATWVGEVARDWLQWVYKIGKSTHRCELL